jgi:hypothetical protein
MKYLFIIVVGLVLFSSNPDLKTHQKAISRELSISLKDDVESISGNSILGSIITEGVTLYSKEYFDKVLEKVIIRRDYYFFSFSDFEWSVYKKEVSFGILGQVFIYNDVTDAYDKVKDFIEGIVLDELSNNKIEDKSDENNEDKNELIKSDIKENSYYFINASNQDLVYFYRTPNEYDRKNSYFNSKEQVFVGEIKDNFGYIEFTNSEGEISKGWIRVNDLTIN